MKKNYDLIGDIHGHAEELNALLKKLNYSKVNGVYSHPERTAIFVGDYIDRGPQIKETLEIVRRMVDGENAIALMGNHEYNALCFHFEEKEGGHLRKHSIKNIIQHFETLKQFQNKQKEYDEYLDWFLTLPLYYETENFKAIHACWEESNVSYLGSELKNDRLTEDLLYRSVIREDNLYHAIDEALKGKEIKLPKGIEFKDKDGALRHEIRIKWWEDPTKSTYKSISVVSLDNLEDHSLDLRLLKNLNYYREDDKPVFFGHYWLSSEYPYLQKQNVCCLDYSVAKKGMLVGYRYNGEKTLTADNFVCTNAMQAI